MPAPATIQPASVTDVHRFLFDLQGYLLLRGALAVQDRIELLREVESLEQRTFDDSAWRRPLPNGKIAQPTRELVQESYLRLNSLLRISAAFDRLIDYPTVLPYLQAFMDGPQLINTWTISKFRGAEAGSWHRGREPDHYSYRNGRIGNRMLNTVFFLTDNGPEDGCMTVIPGGHKSNIDLKWGEYKGLAMPGSIRVTGQAGDVLIFSESLLHNGLPKTTEGRRTNVYFNYGSRDFNVMTYSPEHNHHFAMPPSVRSRFTPQRRAMTEWMEYATADL